MKTLSSILFFFATLPFLLAQNDIAIGSWRVHLTYYNTQTLAVAQNKVYAASENGLFYFNKEDNSLNTLSTLNDLSDSQMGKLAYSEENNTLIIGYRNGNIDLITDDEIINVRSILNSNFSDKTIHHIYLKGDIAYLATSFGVVLLDMKNLIIQDTYSKIGANGSDITVFASSLTSENMFLATSQGLLVAALSDNRLDFRNWQLADSRTNIKQVATFNNELYYAINSDGIYNYDAGAITKTNIAVGATFNNLEVNNNQLLVCTSEQIHILDNQLNETIVAGENTINPKQALFDSEGSLWYADNSLGLVKKNNTTFENYFPTGTLTPSAFRFFQYDNKVLTLAGGYDENFNSQNNEGSFYIFENGEWTNFSSAENSLIATKIPNTSDLNVASYVPSSESFYLGSFQNGLLQWNTNSDEFTVINAPPLNGNNRRAITGLATDSENVLWISNFEASPSIHSLSAGNNWASFSFPSVSGSDKPLDILIDNANQKWVRLANGNGILLFESENKFRHLTEINGQGGLPSSTVNTFVLDREGSVWVGTDNGITEFFAPEFAFDGNNFDGVTPAFENRPLLIGEQITAIAVDGGNRKWIGTKNGLWLFNPEGNILIEHFTQENSPLLSDIIVAISVMPTSGEVFVATENGIISYRAEATKGNVKHENVKIFPNPVRPNYQGTVSIAGLVKDANIKITDASGRLVWRTKAIGGSASWNANSLQGERVNTGIYLVFSYSDDGLETFVGKIAVIR